MAELSESQLLLLDNMMYYSGAASTDKNVAEIAAEMYEAAERAERSGGKTDKAMFSGGFEDNPANIKAIADAILKDPQLRELQPTSSMDTDGVRATCFVDAQGEATLAIRGTGGYYDAWTDNFYGLYESETPVQKEFADWVKKQGDTYDNITITGHSKGGNLAQYATVLCGDSIDRCVSFDGQGFNKEFHEKYADGIAANQGKITSICADDDFVNVLLDPIAGKTVYLDVDSDFSGNHSSFNLWDQNKDLLDKKGNFNHTVDQGGLGKAVNTIADGLVAIINHLPSYLQKSVTNLIGSMIATGMSMDKLTAKDLASLGLDTLIVILETGYRALAKDLPFFFRALIDPLFENLFEKLADLAEEFSHNAPQQDDYRSSSDIESKQSAQSGLTNIHLLVDIQQLNHIAQEFASAITSMENVIQEVCAARVNGTVGTLINPKIRNKGQEIEQLAEKMRNLRAAIDKAAQQYETSEQKAAQLA